MFVQVYVCSHVWSCLAGCLGKFPIDEPKPIERQVLPN